MRSPDQSGNFGRGHLARARRQPRDAEPSTQARCVRLAIPVSRQQRHGLCPERRFGGRRRSVEPTYDLEHAPERAGASVSDAVRQQPARSDRGRRVEAVRPRRRIAGPSEDLRVCVRHQMVRSCHVIKTFSPSHSTTPWRSSMLDDTTTRRRGRSSIPPDLRDNSSRTRRLRPEWLAPLRRRPRPHRRDRRGRSPAARYATSSCPRRANCRVGSRELATSMPMGRRTGRWCSPPDWHAGIADLAAGSAIDLNARLG